MSLNVPKDWEKDKDKILQSEKRAHYFHSFLVNFTRCKVLVERLLKVSLIFFWNTWNVWRISMRVLGIVINWNGGCFPYSSRKLFFQIFYLVFIIFPTTAQKWSFPLKISAVNLTKFEVSCGSGHIYWRNLHGKTSFFELCFVSSHNWQFIKIIIS